MPTVYPPQFSGLEFTEKFGPFALSAISRLIGVDRLISAACVVKTAVTALVERMFKYRQSSEARWSGRWPMYRRRQNRNRVTFNGAVGLSRLLRGAA
ncbi:hypothetical protein [Bradyrhizobium zhanjiangense]|uniref:hypothetical protein n=1 Tax=Bradyrhizobium zhanjiangense TaxID=1325107 RepID=UPI00100915A9